MSTDESARELIIFLHGLGRSRWCWWWLRGRFERAGYRTAAWTYCGFRRRIEVLGEDCARRMAAAERDPAVSAIHVVTHSLGGIILRQALTLGVPAKLGRVVMLAPPNRGSAWARRMGPWLGRLVPALPQLSDAPGSLVNRLPAMPSAVQVAVIAAEHDGKCPLATTHLPGQPADVLDDALHRCRKSPPDPTFANPTPDVHGETIHVVVPGRHTFIMYRAATYAAIRAFLQDGSYPPHRPADSVVFGGC